MHKSTDIILGIPTVSGYILTQEKHKTLILAIYFIYLNRFLWGLRGTNLLVGVGRHLRGVLKEYHIMGGDILSQLFQKTRGMDVLPFRNLLKLLSRGPKYSVSFE